MELYVDSGDLRQVEAIAEYFPIDGLTTNPKLLSDAGDAVRELMPQYRAFTEQHDMKIFFQVTAETAEEMLAQAKALQDYFGEHLIIKIPATKEGYKAVPLCKAAGICVTVTVVHSMLQAYVAAKAGADYVAPYISHIDNLGADGIGCVEEMLAAFENGGYPCKVLGASFRTADQIKKLAVIGCQSVTLAPPLFDLLIAHPSTNVSMDGFKKAWQTRFGETQISELIP